MEYAQKPEDGVAGGECAVSGGICQKGRDTLLGLGSHEDSHWWHVLKLRGTLHVKNRQKENRYSCVCICGLQAVLGA